MIYISKNDFYKSYPYTLEGGWSGKIFCSEEELKKLKEDLEKMLDKSDKV
jgi:hypothetical protein